MPPVRCDTFKIPRPREPSKRSASFTLIESARLAPLKILLVGRAFQTVRVQVPEPRTYAPPSESREIAWLFIADAATDRAIETGGCPPREEPVNLRVDRASSHSILRSSGACNVTGPMRTFHSAIPIGSPNDALPVARVVSASCKPVGETLAS